MRLRLRSVVGLSALLLLIGAMAFAQNYDGTSTFTCSSDNGQLQSCRVNTNAPIQFVRQDSQAACIPGQTYGINRGGVWVTRGCRAEFAVVNDQQAYNQGSYNNGYYDNNGNYHQNSNNGYYDNNGTYHQDRDNDNDRDHDRWRHRHDRNGNYNGAYNNGPYNTQGAYNGPYNGGYVNGGYVGAHPSTYYGKYDDGVSTCSALNGGQQTYCQTDGAFSSATVASQNGRCVQGQTWGYNPDGLWVAGSCSGKFRIQR